MNAIPLFALLATPTFSAMAGPQERVGSLAQAQETFAGIDLDKDGKLSPDEVTRKLQLGASDTRGIDSDRDGFWSKDEFLVFYRQRLVAANVRPAADLEAEATRILAARKAKAAEGSGPRNLSNARRGVKQATPARSLSDALDELEVKASSGQAKQSDFNHVRELLVLDAQAADQAANGQDPAGGEKSALQERLLAALDRLSAAAASGSFSRDEYQDFRAMLVRRARNAANADSAAGSAESNAIQSALLSALDRLEQRAASGQATREDFQRVREQLIARARAAAKGPDGAAAADAELQGAVHRKLIQSLDRLENAAQQGTFSREEYRQLRESFVQRARAMENPGQPRTGNAGNTPDDPGMKLAVDELEKRVDTGQVGPADFKPLRDLIAAKAQETAGKPDPQSANDALAYQKLMQALDRLEKAAQNGTVDRQEFQAFKASFVHRARQIANDSQKSGASAGDKDSGGKRAGAPVATPAGSQPVPADKGGAKRADPARDAGGKSGKSEPKPAPQSPPPSRGKPAGQDSDKPPRG